VKHYITRCRRADFNKIGDEHGVVWVPGGNHPGFACYDDGTFLGYVISPYDKEFCDSDYWKEQPVSKHTTEDSAKSGDELAYEKFKKHNPDMTFDAFVEMKTKQAKAKAEKAKVRAEKQAEKEKAEVLALENSKKIVDDTVAVVDNFLAKINVLEKLSDETMFQRNDDNVKFTRDDSEKHARVDEVVRTAKRELGAYEKPVDSIGLRSCGDMDLLFAMLLPGIKAFAERKWGDFASDVEPQVIERVVEKIVEKSVEIPMPVSESSKSAETKGDEVWVLEWDWQYGHERLEFGSKYEAEKYPVFFENHFKFAKMENFKLSKEIRQVEEFGFVRDDSNELNDG